MIWVSWLRKSSRLNALLHHPLRDALRLLGVDVLLHALDEREDVAHAEDALREAVGVERLEAVGALAGADERDRQRR